MQGSSGMVERMISEIYDTTLEMERQLEARNVEEFEKLLDNRQHLMVEVETFKSENPDFQYVPHLKDKLKATILLDQQLLPKMEELKEELGQELGKTKKKRRVSQKYSPYNKQHYGAFIDMNK